MLTAIIVAAGSSQRMGFDKLTALVAGKAVIEHTLDAFERSSCVADIILVARQDRLREFEKLMRKGSKVRDVIAGGEHRQDSVRAGLDRLDAQTKYVAVHDAARPLVTPEQIERVFVACQEHGAAVLAEPVRDTLKRAGPDPSDSRSEQVLRVTASVDRDQLFIMQTPQIFQRNLLEEAYRAVFSKKFHVTDEVSAVQHLGRKIMLVPNHDFNFKITYDRDLRLAQFILQDRSAAGTSDL
jgi:2-C-methyl-D-erythritol 4-phosphate cytidylyltransferase